MTPEEAIEILDNEYKGIELQIMSLKGTIKENTESFRYRIDVKESLKTAISVLKEIQKYREIGTVEEIRKIIKQGINNCYMAHKYEHPGYEEGMCAGLRTMNGDGEPVYKCKLCNLNYLTKSERSEEE